jgi:abhydrolase domain-containing protein 6
VTTERPVRGAWAAALDGFVRLGLVAAQEAARAREGVYRAPDGVRVRFLHLRRPGRPRAVFLHGFSDRPETFLVTASRLRGYDIVLPALPGFHDGVSPDHRYEVRRYAAWVGGLLDALGVRDAHLCGNSLGGATGLVLAAERPDLVRTLVPLDAAGVEVPGVRSVHDEIRDGVNLFEVRDPREVDAFLARIFHRPPRVGVARAVLAADLARKADRYAAIMAHLRDEGERHQDRGSIVDLAAIRQPVLVAWGEHDSLFPVAVGEHLAASIPGARLHVFRDTGHCPHLERPFALAKVCGSFWAEHDG